MQYYATVSSERATKGQGGNEYVRIEVLDENRERIAFLSFLPLDGNTHMQFALYDPDWRFSEYRQKGERFSMSGIVETKGKRQKDEKREACGHLRNSGDCSDCLPF